MGSRLNFQQAPDFQGVINDGGTPKVFLDGGPTYETLTFATNIPAAEFRVRVLVDGDLRVEITGQQMLDREAYDGKPATSGYFHLSFADAIAKTSQGEAMTGLVTQPGQRVLIEVPLVAAVTPASPTLVMYTETSSNRAEEFRLYVLPEDVPITKTGKNRFIGFRRGTRPGQNFIRRFFGYGPVTHLSSKQDRMSLYGDGELAKAVNDARLVSNGKTVPTSSTCFVYDPILKGNVALDLTDTFSIEALEFFFTTSATTNVLALTEYVQDMRPKAA